MAEQVESGQLGKESLAAWLSAKLHRKESKNAEERTERERTGEKNEKKAAGSREHSKVVRRQF